MSQPLQETQLGTLYPRDHVVAAIPETAAAHEAAGELGRAGIPATDIHMHAPATVVAYEERREEEQNPIQKLGAFISDEDEWANQYREFAEQGEWLLVVRAEDDETAERVRDVLLPHGAHHMRHYRGATVLDLVDPDQ
jgi:hypothetical protein